jgi:hypothetical protein
MTATEVIALVAIGLSALTFIATQFGSRRTATASYVSSLEKRVEVLESDLERCQERNLVLHDENVSLMRKLLRNGGSG